MAELCEVLRSEIIECRIAPGTFLVENQLVRDYSSTKAKVRTALHKLAQEGFLRAIPRMGHLVTLPTQSEIDEIFQLRELIEPWSARTAASTIKDEDIAYLKSLDVSVAPGDPESFHRSLSANRLFHLRIAEIAGNSLITELLANLLDKVHRVLHLGLISAVQAGSLVDDHRTLVGALEAHDCKRAEQVARRQVKEARSMIEPAVGAYWQEGNVGMPFRR